MQRTDFTIPTSDDIELFCCKWFLPDTDKIRGIIQLTHGMAEHILRYENFATFLVEHGYIVYGHDHRGHGRTAASEEDIGYFADKDGFQKVVADVKQVTDFIQKEHPHLPIILFGHSMGSFVARRYVQLFGPTLAGAIFSGTGGDPGLLGKFGKIVARAECRRKGRKTPSPLLDRLSFGNFNKQFRPNRTKFDWLSRDEKQVDAYVADTLCGSIFTAGFFIDLFDGLEIIHRGRELERIPASLPLFLISGKQDPVGDNGKAVRAVYEQYKHHGLENVTLKLYEDARHEILNETNREEVYADILKWIEKIL